MYVIPSITKPKQKKLHVKSKKKKKKYKFREMTKITHPIIYFYFILLLLVRAFHRDFVIFPGHVRVMHEL